MAAPTASWTVVVLLLCAISRSLAGAHDGPEAEVLQLERQIADLRVSVPESGERRVVRAKLIGCAEEIARKNPDSPAAARAFSIVAADWLWRTTHPEAYAEPPRSTEEKNECYRRSAEHWRASVDAAEAARRQGSTADYLPRMIAQGSVMLTGCLERLGDSAAALTVLAKLLSEHPEDPEAQRWGRTRRFGLLWRAGRDREALAEVDALRTAPDRGNRIEGCLLAARYHGKRLDPPNWELAASECQKAIDEADGAIPPGSRHTLAGLETLRAGANRSAERAEPRARAAGLLSVLTDTVRSFEYICAARREEEQPAWERRVKQLSAQGRIERGPRDKVALQASREGESADEVAHTVADVRIVPDDGPEREARLHCTFVRERGIWRLKDIELSAPDRGGEP